VAAKPMHRASAFFISRIGGGFSCDFQGGNEMIYLPTGVLGRAFDSAWEVSLVDEVSDVLEGVTQIHAVSQFLLYLPRGQHALQGIAPAMGLPNGGRLKYNMSRTAGWRIRPETMCKDRNFSRSRRF